MVQNLIWWSKCSYISAYKSWKSVKIIQFRTSTKCIKLTGSNMYIYVYVYIQGVPRVKVTISGECSLC